VQRIAPILYAASRAAHGYIDLSQRRLAELPAEGEIRLCSGQCAESRARVELILGLPDGATAAIGTNACSVIASFRRSSSIWLGWTLNEKE